MEPIMLLLVWIILVLTVLKLWAMERDMGRWRAQTNKLERSLFLQRMGAHLPPSQIDDYAVWDNDDWDDDDDFDGVPVAQLEDEDE